MLLQMGTISPDVGPHTNLIVYGLKPWQLVRYDHYLMLSNFRCNYCSQTRACSLVMQSCLMTSYCIRNIEAMCRGKVCTDVTEKAILLN